MRHIENFCFTGESFRYTSTVLLKDVVNRHDIREPSQLDLIIRFIFDNCGNITTAKRVSDYLKTQQVEVRARGFQVSVAKYRDREIDFVAERDSGIRWQNLLDFLTSTI